MTVHSRQAWTDTKNACADEFRAAEVEGVCIHWVGSELSDALRRGERAAVAAFLRECRARNVADDYCDIEYNWAVAGNGDEWACRGLKYDGGANGDVTSNDRFVSVLVIYPVGGKLTARQIEGVRQAVRRIRDKYPQATKIVPHQQFRPTQCPGPHALKLIASGDFDPRQRKLRARIRQVRALLERLVDRLS